MARSRVLLVNPPLHDFTAYDFWLRPYGMLRVAGRIQHACDLEVFDFLVARVTNPWGRGRFPEQVIARPQAFRDIPRRFRRFGRPRAEFHEFLQSRSFDAVLVQTMMTYWYPGLREVIEDVRRFQPQATIVLGGVYATLLPSHAQSLGADLVVRGSELAPLFRLLSIDPVDAPPYWNGSLRQVGVMKLTRVARSGAHIVPCRSLLRVSPSDPRTSAWRRFGASRAWVREMLLSTMTPCSSDPAIAWRPFCGL